MKIRSFSIAIGVLSVSALLTQTAIAKKGQHGGGTSILHWMESLSVDGLTINAKRVAQGAADNQRLSLVVSGLDSNAAYQLFAVIGTDTNQVFVGDFTTDAKGADSVTWVKKNTGKGKAGGTALPDVLNPISSIRELVIVNTSTTQTVATADLTNPDKLQYLVKRMLTNEGSEPSAAAALRLHATQSFVQFSLQATGLAPTSSYFVAVNDVLETNVTTDASGNVSLSALPDGSPDILDVQSLAIVNATSNSVLSTTLP